MLHIHKETDIDVPDADIVQWHPAERRRPHKVTRAIAQPASHKPSRRSPHKTTDIQRRILLAEFEDNPNPGPPKREQLAQLLNVERRIIKNWFSNQRAVRRRKEVRRHGHSSRSATASESGSGDEIDTQMGEIMTGPPRCLQIYDKDLWTFIPQYINNTIHSSTPPNVLRSTTNAKYQHPPLLTHPPSSKKSPEASTRGMTLQIVQPSRSVHLTSKSPPTPSRPSSMFPSPSSWTPAPQNHPYSRVRLTIDQPVSRNEGEAYSVLIQGYPESAMRTSLRVK